jgi:hypothetical protein
VPRLFIVYINSGIDVKLGGFTIDITKEIKARLDEIIITTYIPNKSEWTNHRTRKKR